MMRVTIQRSGHPHPLFIYLEGKEIEMAVSQATQDFIAAMQARAKAIADASETAIQARIDAAVKAATDAKDAEIVQDDADGAKALQDALDADFPAPGA